MGEMKLISTVKNGDLELVKEPLKGEIHINQVSNSGTPTNIIAVEKPILKF